MTRISAEIIVDRGGFDVRVDVTATLEPPEPDVGLQGYGYSDLKAFDALTGEPMELTELEQELAGDALSKVANDEGGFDEELT